MVSRTHRDKKRREKSKDVDSVMTTSIVWVGSGVITNTLTGSDTFDPRVPIDQPGEEGDDVLVWADVPKALKQRLENKPQRITQECLVGNVERILCLYESDIVTHVIRQQL